MISCPYYDIYPIVTLMCVVSFTRIQELPRGIIWGELQNFEIKMFIQDIHLYFIFEITYA